MEATLEVTLAPELDFDFSFFATPDAASCRAVGDFHLTALLRNLTQLFAGDDARLELAAQHVAAIEDLLRVG